MPTVITLQNGNSIETEEDPQTLADRFHESGRDNTLTKVDTDEQPVWINPRALATIS